MDRTKTERESLNRQEIPSQISTSQVTSSTLKVLDKESSEPGAPINSAPGSLKAPSARKNHERRKTPKRMTNSLLEFLKQLAKVEGRKGRVAVGRAALELAKDPRALAEPSGIDWSYWLARWASMTHTERSYAARIDILPKLLKTPSVPETTGKKNVNTEQKQPSKEDCVRSLRNFEKWGWDKNKIAELAALVGIENWSSDRRI
jgi:hypothetical protein